MTKKKKWYIVGDEDARDKEDVWTISVDPEHAGWETGGSEGYGLPKEVAEWIVDVLNSTRGDIGWYMDKWGYWKKRLM